MNNPSDNPDGVTREWFDTYMVPNYAPIETIPVRGAGSRVWDQADRELIDFAGGIAVSALGHAHPRLVQALTEQAGRLWHVSNAMATEPALRLARRLCESTFAEQVYFANSGAEANEAALKLARKYASDHFGPAKREILAFENAFHGRTLFTVSAGGQAKYRAGFEPLPGGIRHAPFNDIDALRAAIGDDTCAVIMEPIQGEGGVREADPDFMRTARELCDRHQALLIFDEIQTGVGRTGRLYAYMHGEVVPDILTTAKGLGGGFPIAAMLTTRAIAASFTVGTHGSTYGGNPMGCAVANAVLELVDDESLMREVERKRERILAGLHQINRQIALFREFRGRGLLLGCALADSYLGRGRDFQRCAEAEGLLTLVAGPDVVRLAPSLVIPDADIDEGLARLGAACRAFAAG